MWIGQSGEKVWTCHVHHVITANRKLAFRGLFLKETLKKIKKIKETLNLNLFW